MELQLPEAAAGLNAFVAASKSGSKVMYGPLYSTIDLFGLSRAVAPLTYTLPATNAAFFQASMGQPGQGFARELRLSETNLDGAPGQLPAGYSYIGTAVGLWMPPQLPMHVKDFLTRHSSLKNERHSHVWKMGATQFWPCAEFGHQSLSAVAEIANTIIQYGVNGRVGMRQLPRGAELYFPAKEVIKFSIDTYESVNITTDGAVWNGIAFGVAGSNSLDPTDGCCITLIMEGWRFEELTA